MFGIVERYQLVVTDERGKRETRMSVPGYALWVEVGVESADRMSLPTPKGGMPAAYRLVDEQSGDALMFDRPVAETVRGAGADYRVRLAPCLP